MKPTPHKYLLVLSIPGLSFLAMFSHGVLTFLPLIYSFGLIPLLEFLFQPSSANLTEQEEVIFLQNKWFDWIVYLMVPVQYALVLTFLYVIGEKGLSTTDIIGRITALGLCCGVIGINVAHELGHRLNKTERTLGKLLLLTSLYMHFYIEHNRGHHKHVGTVEDPSTARFKEPLYFFLVRSTFFTWIKAWKLEAERLQGIGKSAWSWRNEMLFFQVIQLSVVIAIFSLIGPMTALYFVLAAIMGFLLLESVNYIEHYGLLRKRLNTGRYERTLPKHSWNSDHPVGRLVLFELSRHSDHHFIASRKYQILRHHDDSPQMPTGYPGMILLATIPPLWMAVMNKRVRRAGQISEKEHESVH